MAPKSCTTFAALISLLATLIIVLVFATQPAQTLKCYCNDGNCLNDTCFTSDSNESTCYLNFKRRKNETTKQYDFYEHYGCFSGGDNLGPLQCHARFDKFVEPTMVRCCKNEDFCNKYLDEPTEKDDPRWGETEPPAAPDDGTIVLTRSQAVLILVVIVILLLFALYTVTIFTINVCRLRSSKVSSKTSSSCFIETDLELCGDNQAVASTCNSTRSCSSSEDSCHKSERAVSEDSFMASELTSGLGERILNQRTIARAVGSSKTDPVGHGRYGRVFRGSYHGEDVAVKAFRTIDQESWQREDKILRSLNHENIVRFIASECTSLDNSSTEIWMFLEYCPYGSLCDYLDHNEILGEAQAVKILYSIINGLNYLHEDYAQTSSLYKPSIAHRDIKSKNILMKNPESCCIADLGHALIKVDEDTLDYLRDEKLPEDSFKHFQVGTVRYMAPEILKKDNRLNYRQFVTFAQADLYQYGLILWEVCHRTALDILHPAGPHYLPYDGVVPHNPELEDMAKIVCEDQYRPPIYPKWDKYPYMKRLTQLMVECWRPNPKARMETLGVKKKLREMYYLIMPNNQHQFQVNLYNNFSLSPTTRYDRDRTRSSDVTL